MMMMMLMMTMLTSDKDDDDDGLRLSPYLVLNSDYKHYFLNIII